MRIQALSLATALAAYSVAAQAATAAIHHERQLAPPARPTPVSTIQLVDSRPTAAPTPSLTLPLSVNTDPQIESSIPFLLAAVTWGASADPASPEPAAQPDVPVTAGFLAVFAAGAVAHTVQCHRTRRLRMPHLRPALAGLVLAFCLLRVAACGVRIAWARTPGNWDLMLAVGVLLNVGSVVIFMTNALLGQRLIRYLSLTSLSAPRGRLIGVWLSALFLLLAIISSVAILALYITTAKRAIDLFKSGATSNDDPQTILNLFRASMAWLAALGALSLLVAASVFLAASTHLRRLGQVKKKLVVFFLGGALLEIGQGIRLAAVFRAGSTAGRVPFYVAGFMLEVFVVLLYAVADLDVLFHDEHINTFALAKRRRPRTAPFGFFRNDEHGIPRGASRDPASGIIIRKSVDISVVRLDENVQQRSSPSCGDVSLTRSPSSGSITLTTSRPESALSDISFPTSSSPAPARFGPPARGLPAGFAERAKRSREEMLGKEPVVSPAHSIWNMNEDPQRALPPPSRYDPLTQGRGRRRTGLRELEQQLDDYETAVQQPEDRLSLY